MHYVMNKARDLCARMRQQAKAKHREGRKRVLLERQITRDVERQVAQAARERQWREEALRREIKMQQEEEEEEKVKAKLREIVVIEQQEQGREVETLGLSQLHYIRQTLLRRQGLTPLLQHSQRMRQHRIQESIAETHHQQLSLLHALRLWRSTTCERKVAKKERHQNHFLALAHKLRLRSLCRQSLASWKATMESDRAQALRIEGLHQSRQLQQCFQKWRAQVQQNQRLRKGALLVSVKRLLCVCVCVC